MYGRISWSERLKVSERRLRTLFERLLKDDMVRVVSKHPKFTIYSVTNYEKYNSPESRQSLAGISPDSDQQSDQQKTHIQQGFAIGADQQSDSKTTSRRPADDQQTTTQEEGSNKVNKVNKEKEDYIFLEDMPDVKITKSQFDKLTILLGSEEKTMSKLYSFASWIISQPPKKQASASAYLSIINWYKRDLEKQCAATSERTNINGGDNSGRNGTGDTGIVVPIVSGKPKTLTERFARRG